MLGSSDGSRRWTAVVVVGETVPVGSSGGSWWAAVSVSRWQWLVVMVVVVRGSCRQWWLMAVGSSGVRWCVVVGRAGGGLWGGGVGGGMC